MNYQEFSQSKKVELKSYLPFLTVSENRKGVLDVDTVKGCELGMAAHPFGGCYGECYALKIAKTYKIDFNKSVLRKIKKSKFLEMFFKIKNHNSQWYRIGTFGDPCHDWEHTVSVCEAFKHSGKTPVIITKHLRKLDDCQLERLRVIGAVVKVIFRQLKKDSSQ